MFYPNNVLDKRKLKFPQVSDYILYFGAVVRTKDEMHYQLSRSGFYLGCLTTIQPKRVQYIFDNMLSHTKIEMHDDLILVCFTSKPRLGTKFFAFPLSMRESSFQLNCAGNSLLLNFTTLQFQNKAWRYNLRV